MSRLFLRRDLTFAAVAMLVAVQAVIRYGSTLDPAVAWYLYAGGRLLDGATLYHQIIEVNPPLGLWLCAAVVAAANMISVDPTLLLKTILLLLTGASVIASARLLSAATDVSAATRHLLVILLAAVMLFLPAAEFGQRDHVAIVTITPWVLLRWNRLLGQKVPWGLAVAIGIGAALGMWLKPHFVFVLVPIEVTILFATRSPRSILNIETLLVIGFGLIYMVLIRMNWSGYLLATIALYGSRAYIPIYGVPYGTVLVRLIVPVVLAGAAIASTRLLSERLQLLRTLLFVAGATFVGTYVLQSGLHYQTMPAQNFLALAAGLVVARVLAGEVRLENFNQRLVVAGAAGAILAVFAGVWSSQVAPYRGRPFEAAIAKEAPGAHSFFVASADVADSFPLVNRTGLIWASRFPSLWLSPYVATRLDEGGGPGDDIGRFALDATVSDLIAFRPDIVFVNQASERPWYRGAPLDYLAFWDNDPRFFSFWKEYERRGSVGDFGVYVRGAAPKSASSARTNRDADRSDPFGCILADVVNSYC